MLQLAPASAIPLADHNIDRAAHRRTDEVWLDTAFSSDTVQIMMVQDGAPLLSGAVGQQGPREIVWLGPQAAMLSPKAKRLFLGETDRHAPVFALEVPSSFRLSDSPIAGLGIFDEPRASFMGLSAYDGGLAATARSIFEWHRRHGHCSNCGSKTEIKEAGWKRACEDCGVEHFPRTDPVAIMVVEKDGKCLLGRQAVWPPGMWSCLAGFIEPGETIEQAAARETFEEAGVRTTGKAEYLFCQPWPFPSSLMVGLILEAASDEITVDPNELEQARWFTRDEVAAIMNGTHAEVVRPREIAVAHHVIKAWLQRQPA